MHPLSRRCYSHLESGFRRLSQIPYRKGIYHSHFRRYQSTDSSSADSFSSDVDFKDEPPRAAAIVVGGGPAGIAAVGNFLEIFSGGKIIWIDKSFAGGMIPQYLDPLPSYCTAGDYVRFAQTLPTLARLWTAPFSKNSVKTLQRLDQDKPCQLSYVGNMLKSLTTRLQNHDRVQAVTGAATLLRREWTVTVDDFTSSIPGLTQLTFRSKIVVLCTGTKPSIPALPVHVSQWPVYTGFSQERLSQALPANRPITMAVIGSGHSAVHVLRNLVGLASTTHPHLRIRWITRTPNFTYSEHVADSDHGPVILHKYDGLTYETADYARTQLDGDALHTSEAGQFIERVLLPTLPAQPSPSSALRAKDLSWASRQAELEKHALAAALHDVDHAIQAIGFVRTRAPEIRPALDADAVPAGGKPRTLAFDSRTGSFYPSGGDRTKVIGLFGAGAAFPEVVPTPEMANKPRVGVWWFMDFLKRVAPAWVRATATGTFPKEFVEQRKSWWGGPRERPENLHKWKEQMQEGENEEQQGQKSWDQML
ncbi:hypothetical protein VTJ04DRAFT_2850 [Mycothermus thermophilus]|uniref:uncharacterized protein n=1 Tax=Humicola insolens TaxID=85995 RepID=UPI003743CEE5